ncbi:hypothetical protein FRC07_005276 [Ceratobasidium sp. 392]|nr:hypothetical protein FRC07_005276 [Ceratobasidium sp. 392]
MTFAPLRSLGLCLTVVVNLVQVVLGWGFLPPRRVQEGANATFQITNNDGGGFFYPYTMTVFKKVLGKPDEQVGLVYTNESPFYWDCNQPAGTVLEFRLVSKANVNYATSGNMTVQPGAEAAASSISTQSVVSTASLFSKTAAQPTQTESGPQYGKANISTGAIVGVTVAGVLLLILLLLIAWWAYRRRKSKVAPEADHNNDTITPFMHSQSHQRMLPMGYVGGYATPSEEPPEYTPTSEARDTWGPSDLTSYPSTYASTSTPSESGGTGVPERSGSHAPIRNEKRRHVPPSVVRS